MPKIDRNDAEVRSGATYPAAFRGPCMGRRWQNLGDVVGLTQFGVVRMVLPPGVWSSQRHWHTREDEFVWVLEGELVMVTDAGETTMRAGDCAGFPANDGDGHHLQNRSDRDAVILVVGSRVQGDAGEYPDIDLAWRPDAGGVVHKDGTPYGEG